MKTVKLEFVIFEITQENAKFLWNTAVSILQFFGFDVTGSVIEVTKFDFHNDEEEKIK